MVDPKAEFYEMYSEFFREQGYTVCAYNLLDLFASDGWNCVTETANDLNLVQNVAEIIIKNTSSESDKDDFWAKAEKNLLMALLHYVGTMTYPGTDKLLPVEERSLGTIYKILSSTSVQELDAKFRSLPPDHPALPPYGIFRQAHKQIWGNITVCLYSYPKKKNKCKAFELPANTVMFSRITVNMNFIFTRRKENKLWISKILI